MTAYEDSILTMTQNKLYNNSDKLVVTDDDNIDTRFLVFSFS